MYLIQDNSCREAKKHWKTCVKHYSDTSCIKRVKNIMHLRQDLNLLDGVAIFYVKNGTRILVSWNAAALSFVECMMCWWIISKFHMVWENSHMNDIALCLYITDRQSYKWYGVHFGVRFLTKLPPWYAHNVTYAILIIRLLSHFLFAVFPILSAMIYQYPLNPQMVVGAVSSLYRRFAMYRT